MFFGSQSARTREQSVSFTNYLQNKQKLKVLILGAYKPSTALKRLRELRVCMVEKGFLSTMLAESFPDSTCYSKDLDEHYTIKSRILISDWADVPIFVFFKKTDNQGVASEITYTCDNLSDKLSCCAVFFEGSLKNFSSQVKGSIKIAKKVSYETFSNDEELCNLTCGHSRKMLDRLFYYL